MPSTILSSTARNPLNAPPLIWVFTLSALLLAARGESQAVPRADPFRQLGVPETRQTTRIPAIRRLDRSTAADENLALRSAEHFRSGLLGAETGAAGVNRWTTGGPAGGDILSLAIDPETPSTLYAGGWGLFRSTDGGESWLELDVAPAIFQFLALAVDSQASATVYAGTTVGLFRSRDGGGSWTAINDGFRPSGGAFALAVDPQEPAILYAGNGSFGVYRSTDGGDSWTAVNDGLGDNLHVRALAVDPLTPATVYAGMKPVGDGLGGVYRSTDSGASWQRIGLPDNAEVAALAVDPRSPAILFAATIGFGLYRSTDGGASWAPAHEGITSRRFLAVAIDAESPSVVYAGTLRSVYRSTDGGTSWQPAGQGLLAAVRALAVDPETPSTLYAGAIDGGMFRSTDSGGGWRRISDGLDPLAVRALAVDPATPSRLYAATAHGLFRSTDGGGAWLPINLELTVSPLSSPPSGTLQALVIDPHVPSTLYVASRLRGVFFSTTGGDRWTPINGAGLGDYRVHALAVVPGPPATLLAGTRTGIFRADTVGHDWETVLAGVEVRSFASSPAAPTTVYANTPGGSFRSLDSGASWQSIAGELPDPRARILAVDPADPFTLYAATGLYPPTGHMLFRSTDGGASWSEILAARLDALVIDPADPQTLYASANGSVRRSVDGGASWWPLATGLPSSTVGPLVLDPGSPPVLHAGTAEGVFHQRLVTALAPHDGRFRVAVDWREFGGAVGPGNVVVVGGGPGGPVALASRDSAVVEFFGPDNWELLIKILDGRALTEHFWVFFAAATNVEIEVSVLDTGCGYQRTYWNPLGQAAVAVTDVEALPDCPFPAPPSCVADEDTLCLGEDGRFQVEIAWRDFLDRSGAGRQVLLPQGGLAESRDSGLFDFFGPDNWELLVKVLDGCRFNGRFWVFSAATTDVEYELRVTDTASGEVRTYHNPLGVDAAAVTDVEAFACVP